MLEIIIFAIIQGITEPLPISSSGHLQLLNYFFSIGGTSLVLEVLVNFGSFLAIIFIYRRLLMNIFSDTFKYARTRDLKYYDNFRYFWYVALATVPAALIGFLFQEQIEKYLLNPFVTGLMLIITGLLLFAIRNFKGVMQVKHLKLLQIIVIGIFQAFALIPGLSRSGSTIVGDSLMGLSRKEAFNFSFLLYIPISIAVLIGNISAIFSLEVSTIIIGLAVSFGGTYLATKLFYQIVLSGKLIYFSIYCILIGVLTIIIL